MKATHSDIVKIFRSNGYAVSETVGRYIKIMTRGEDVALIEGSFWTYYPSVFEAERSAR